MKRQKSCGPRLGKLVHQLPGVVTFAYDLRFRRVIARWKGIVEEIHFGGSIMPSAIIEHLNLKKPSFRPLKMAPEVKHAKNSKLPKLPENYFEPVGKGGWPPISTWITSRVASGCRCTASQNPLKNLGKVVHHRVPLFLEGLLEQHFDRISYSLIFLFFPHGRSSGFARLISQRFNQIEPQLLIP
jgi:hypothetical protein